MVLRVSIGAMLAAILLTAWSYVFWAVLTVPDEFVRPLPAGEDLARALSRNVPESGVYIWPAPRSESGDDAAESLRQFEQLHRKGPLVHLFFCREGSVPYSITTCARSLLQFFAAALLASGLLVAAQFRLRSFAARAGFVFVAGLFATTLTNLGQPIWFNHPWGYHWLMAVYDSSNALLMGIVLALIVKPDDEHHSSLDGE